MCRQKTERRIGSPPPMRGKDFSLLRDNGIDRITPAYAGKSNVIANFDFRSEDHPRLCGEKIAGPAGSEGATGSPPPMRGKARFRLTPTHFIRITPAYAGKSAKYFFEAFFWEDHPRLCGEKGLYPTRLIASMGSPPPMRGKADAYDNLLNYTWITPAYAGKS